MGQIIIKATLFTDDIMYRFTNSDSIIITLVSSLQLVEV